WDGFLAVTDGQKIYYTRNGALGLDAEGNLVHMASGMRVVTVSSPGGGSNDTAISPNSTVSIPMGQTSTAQATTEVVLGGNLDSRATANTEYKLTAHVYDSLGNGHDITVTFKRTATDGTWDVSATSADGTVAIDNPAQVTFDANGKPTVEGLNFHMTLTTPQGATPTLDAKFTLGNLTQLAQESTANLRSQDGVPPGMLSGLSIREDGTIIGVYSNGLTKSMGQIVTAQFQNTGGLESIGNTLFNISPNSGTPVYGVPGASGSGSLRSGYLEGSNVNLTQEFGQMIVTQRGFQANSRVVTSSDQMMQELMNIVR
ncbi:MAG: hypothetical protein C4321_10700, partial [Chloroflexota bacterium]